MRIIKEINKGNLKITVFKYQEKISIKFENDLNEILIRFREGGLEEGDINNFLTEAQINFYSKTLDAINDNKSNHLIDMKDGKDTAFPEII